MAHIGTVVTSLEWPRTHFSNPLPQHETPPWLRLDAFREVKIVVSVMVRPLAEDVTVRWR